MKAVTFPNGPITMAGNLYTPEGFGPQGSYSAIAVVHPGGGVKEQAAGLYAGKLAEQGFVALAFDASYQGDSGGEPHFLETRPPALRTCTPPWTTFRRWTTSIPSASASSAYAPAVPTPSMPP